MIVRGTVKWYYAFLFLPLSGAIPSLGKNHGAIPRAGAPIVRIFLLELYVRKEQFSGIMLPMVLVVRLLFKTKIGSQRITTLSLISSILCTANISP